MISKSERLFLRGIPMNRTPAHERPAFGRPPLAVALLAHASAAYPLVLLGSLY